MLRTEPKVPMKFQPLQLLCVCGQTPARIESVGLTSEYELVLHWTCEACHRTVYATKTLADCCRECPESEGSAGAAVARTTAAPDLDDATFLRALGIRLPED